MSTKPTDAPNVQNLNVWGNSLSAGRTAEELFLFEMRQAGFLIDQANAVEVRNMDYHFPRQMADLKWLTSPYPTSGGRKTPAGLDSEEHVTLDVANINKYGDFDFIFLAVDYTAKGVSTRGIYWITAGEVKRIISELPGRVYSRSERTRFDKVQKVGISIHECRPLYVSGADNEALVDRILLTLKTRKSA